jgi:hypothetical protein
MDIRARSISFASRPRRPYGPPDHERAGETFSPSPHFDSQTSGGKPAALVPGAVHITDTHSGHNIMIDMSKAALLTPRQTSVDLDQQERRGASVSLTAKSLN